MGLIQTQITMPTIVTVDAQFIDHARDMLGRGEHAGETTRASEHHREMLEFGYGYQRLKQGDKSWTPIPDFLFQLCEESLKRLEMATGQKLPAASEYDNYIVSSYETGTRLRPHFDVSQTTAKYGGFYFGDPIVAVILKADTKGGLYFETGSKTRMHVHETDGAAYLIDGDHRHKYPHGVDIETGRISVTCRRVIFTGEPLGLRHAAP